MSSPVSLDTIVANAKAFVASLEVRIRSDGPSHTVSLYEPESDDSDDAMFMEMTADQKGKVYYPSKEKNERLAFKMKLANGKSCDYEVEYQHEPRIGVTVMIDIEELCVARLIDEMKKLLPADAVLFSQIVGSGIDLWYDSLGFTIKPHVFPAGQSQPRCNVHDATLVLADWRSSPQTGDKRPAAEADASSCKKAKTDESKD